MLRGENVHEFAFHYLFMSFFSVRDLKPLSSKLELLS
jgi:hypothetical protein